MIMLLMKIDGNKNGKDSEALDGWSNRVLAFSTKDYEVFTKAIPL